MTYRGYDELGRLIKEADPNGNITRYCYDAIGRLIKVIRPGDSEDSPTLRYIYDDTNNKKTEIVKRDDGDTTAIIYTYDGYGRLTEKEIIREGENSIIKNIYDEYDNLVKTVSPTSDTTYYKYDYGHRLTQIIYPDNTPSDTSDNPRTVYEYTTEQYTPPEYDHSIYVDVTTEIKIPKITD